MVMFLLVGAAPSLAAALSAPLTPSGCSLPQKVYRYPIVLKGPSELHVFEIHSLMAFARRKDGFERVPIQIDEVNQRGEFVLDQGLPFTVRTDDGIFDDNDEVVIDGTQLGLAITDRDLPVSLAPEGVALYRLRACQNGVFLGDLLLVSGHRSLLMASEPPQVTFDPVTATVVSSLYRYYFPKTHPAMLGEVHLRHAGQEWPLTRSAQFLMPLKTSPWLPDFTFETEDFQSVIESWRTGPIRSIVAVGVKYSAFLSIFRLHLFTELVFYRNRFEIPTPIEFIFDPSSYLEPGSGIVYSLELPPGQSLRFESNLPRLPGVPARQALEEASTQPSPQHYIAEAHRAEGSIRIEVTTDTRMLERSPPPFMIAASDYENKAIQRHWPWLSRLRGDLGIYIDFSGLRQGVYDFALDLLLSSDANERFTDYGNVKAEFDPLAGFADVAPSLKYPAASRN